MMGRTLSLALTALLLSGCLETLDLGGIDGGAAPQPPAQATGIEAFGIIQRAELPGADLVSVELDVLTLTPEPGYVGGVRNPRLIVGDAEFELVSAATPGVFVLDSNMEPRLGYVPGGWYGFAFEVVDLQGAVEEYEAYVQAPVEPHRIDLPPSLVHYASEPMTLNLASMDDGGYIRVLAEQVTWSSFVYEGPQSFASAADALVAVRGPSETVPGAAFPEAGSYVVEVSNLGITRAPGGEHMSANFGPNSWFAAGEVRYAEVEIEFGF